MTALSNPDPKKEPEEIAKFRRDYEEALVNARVSAEHTATDGWRNLYGNHVEHVQKSRKTISDRPSAILDPMRLRHLTEDEEKDLGEIKKEAVSIREYDEMFTRQTIEPVTAPLQECASVIERARSSAQAAVREYGLGNRGLVEAMETVIDTMPRVKFMTASGRLIVGAD